MQLSSRVAIVLAFALPLAACSNDANPIRDIAIASGVTGGEPKAAPDFISRTRQPGGDYVPVGTSAPKRDYRAKTAAEVKGAEADLDNVRRRNEAAGRAAAPAQN